MQFFSCLCVCYYVIILTIMKLNLDHKMLTTQLKTTDEIYIHYYLNCYNGQLPNLAVGFIITNNFANTLPVIPLPK